MADRDPARRLGAGGAVPLWPQPHRGALALDHGGVRSLPAPGSPSRSCSRTDRPADHLIGRVLSSRRCSRRSSTSSITAWRRRRRSRHTALTTSGRPTSSPTNARARCPRRSPSSAASATSSSNPAVAVELIEVANDRFYGASDPADPPALPSVQSVSFVR